MFKPILLILGQNQLFGAPSPTFSGTTESSYSNLHWNALHVESGIGQPVFFPDFGALFGALGRSISMFLIFTYLFR